MAGHETVKALLVDHLTDHLAPWLEVVRAGDTWPLDPKLTAASDILPEGDDQWPCVLVSSTKMTRRTSKAADAVATSEFLGRYAVTVTVACRAVKERDPDSAATGRDRMLQAVRWLLLTAPGLDAASTCLFNDANQPMVEETDPVAVDAKGRPVALGRITFAVQHAETVPDPASVVTDSASVSLSVTDADGTLYTEAPAYDDGLTVYDDTHTAYDGGVAWPPQ